MFVGKHAVTVSTTDEKICSIWSATTIHVVEQAVSNKTRLDTMIHCSLAAGQGQR